MRELAKDEYMLATNYHELTRRKLLKMPLPVAMEYKRQDKRRGLPAANEYKGKINAEVQRRREIQIRSIPCLPTGRSYSLYSLSDMYL